MEIIKVFEYPQRYDNLFALYQENKEQFKTVSKASYPSDRFEFASAEDMNQYHRIEVVDNGKDPLLVYGYYVISGPKNSFTVKKRIILRITDKMRVDYCGMLYYTSLPLGDIGNLWIFDNLKKVNNELYQVMFDTLMTKCSWIRFYNEYHINISSKYVLKHKLYSLKKYASHYFPGFNFKTVKTLLDDNKTNKYYVDFYLIKNNQKYFRNQNNARMDLIFGDHMSYNPIFSSALSVAKIYGKQINLGWSDRKLEEFVDEHSFELKNLYFKIYNKSLVVDPVFTKFAEHFNLKIVKDHKDLAEIGLNNKNCVGGYYDRINTGEVCVFTRDNYIMEITKMYEGGKVHVNLAQILGKYNEKIDYDIRKQVEKEIHQYNLDNGMNEHYNSTEDSMECSSPEPCLGVAEPNEVTREPYAVTRNPTE